MARRINIDGGTGKVKADDRAFTISKNNQAGVHHDVEWKVDGGTATYTVNFTAGSPFANPSPFSMPPNGTHNPGSLASTGVNLNSAYKYEIRTGNTVTDDPFVIIED